MTRSAILLLALSSIVLIGGLVLAVLGLAADVAAPETIIWVTVLLFGLLFCAGLLLGGTHTPSRLRQRR